MVEDREFDDDPAVYQITGPYKPKDVIRVGREMVEEVFG